MARHDDRLRAPTGRRLDHLALQARRLAGAGRVHASLQHQMGDLSPEPEVAAMMHELDRLPPTFVLEEQDGPVAFLSELEADRRAEPFRGPVDHLPAHALARFKLKN